MDEIIWIPESLVLDIHSSLIKESGDIPGLLNPHLLSSALARPQNLFTYGSGVNLFDLAAAYGYGFVKNHCFVGANKRIALAVVYVFLNLNGYKLIASKQETFKIIVGLAEDLVTQKVFADWLASNSQLTLQPPQ